MKDILTARREAGTPCGIEYANRLEAMPPDEAADEIYDMVCLCADEDLGYEISCDLQLHPKAAAQIAIAIERKRAAESTSSDDDQEAAALRRLTDPALAWEIDDGERREVGPKWLLK